jgi:quercetin dioxygenase-like cupin family protein
MGERRELAGKQTMRKDGTNHNREDQMATLRSFACALAVALATPSIAAYAQQAPQPVTAGASTGIKRTMLQKFEAPGSNNETIIGLAEVAPGASIGRHTHFGVEGGYVLEGDFVMMIAGQPDKALKAGDSYNVPPGAAHDAKAGPNGAKVLATYVVEKGKPLATPAP